MTTRGCAASYFSILVHTDSGRKVSTDFGPFKQPAGDNVRAAAWLERSVEARGDDTRALVNYAVALVRSGRPGEALTVCERKRTLPKPRGMALVLLSLEGECQRALADGEDPEGLN